MFYNVVAGLPSFEGVGDKESIVKELIEENGVENVQGGIKPGATDAPPAQEIKVNGELKKATPEKKKKGCKC